MNDAEDTTGPPRPDRSMDLLREIRESAVDADYTRERAWTEPAHLRWLRLPVIVVTAALLAMSVISTTQAAPEQAKNREELVDNIEQTRARQDDLRLRSAELQDEVLALEEQALAHDEGRAWVEQEYADLAVVAAASPVSGPGLEIIVDDADGDAAEDRVIDTDLQQLVNGMWRSGAEAIAINGHRLSSLTAIRGAGDAITVDYRSLTRPYTVQVIGDPQELQQNFPATEGGVWWNYLTGNLGMEMDVSQSSSLRLPAASRTTLRYAEGETE